MYRENFVWMPPTVLLQLPLEFYPIWYCRADVNYLALHISISYLDDLFLRYCLVVYHMNSAMLGTHDVVHAMS